MLSVFPPGEQQRQGNAVRGWLSLMVCGTIHFAAWSSCSGFLELPHNTSPTPGSQDVICQAALVLAQQSNSPLVSRDIQLLTTGVFPLH